MPYRRENQRRSMAEFLARSRGLRLDIKGANPNIARRIKRVKQEKERECDDVFARFYKSVVVNHPERPPPSKAATKVILRQAGVDDPVIRQCVADRTYMMKPVENTYSEAMALTYLDIDRQIKNAKARFRRAQGDRTRQTQISKEIARLLKRKSNLRLQTIGTTRNTKRRAKQVGRNVTIQYIKNNPKKPGWRH